MPQTAQVFEPEYPVINAQPSMFAVIKNFGFGDYSRLLFGSAVGAAFGFAAGEHACLPTGEPP
jgi:hypothetical protein